MSAIRVKQYINVKTSSAAAAAAAFAFVIGCAASTTTQAALLYATNGTAVSRFDSTSPGSVTSVPITGLQAGEVILDIDVRTSTGVLYGLGATSRLYTINPQNGVATPVGSSGAFSLNGTAFAVDFNPINEQIRVVSNTEQNLRLNPDTGALTGTDTPLNPAGNIVANAYDRNFLGSLATTLYAIDSAAGTLVNIGSINGTPSSPNGGQVTTVGSMGLGTNLNESIGFDIFGSGSQTAYATIVTGGVSRLYSINLATGAATLVGSIGAGTTPFPGLAAAAVSGDGTWLANRSGDWNDGANWTGGIPNSAGATARFLGAILSPQTVFTNVAVTVGTIQFNNANTYVIAGAGSLNIQLSSGTGLIQVLQGTHKINLPLTFSSNTSISVTAGATLILANPTTVKANQTVTKTGNVLIQAPLTLESGAILSLASGTTSLFSAPSLGAEAKIDVKNTTLTIDYRGQTTPAAAIKSQLTTGYANGAWNGPGIDTSSATAQTGLGWKDNAAAQSLNVKYTYYGDTNLDGQVDVTDLGAFATNWQTSAPWVGGDFNYDGFVDVTDLGLLATNWQAGATGSSLGDVSFRQALQSLGLASAEVPEPALPALLAVVVGAAMARGRVRRRVILVRKTA